MELHNFLLFVCVTSHYMDEYDINKTNYDKNN